MLRLRLQSRLLIAVWLLKIALSIVFLYASIGSLVSPQEWVGYLPTIATHFVPAELLLKIVSAYELLIVAWLLSGKYTPYAAGAAALTLAGIITANFSLFIITFRDIALIFAALALGVLTWESGAGGESKSKGHDHRGV